jgi:hypothetical protein
VSKSVAHISVPKRLLLRLHGDEGDRMDRDWLANWTEAWARRGVIATPDGFVGWPKAGASGTEIDGLDHYVADSLVGEAMALEPVVLMSAEILKTNTGERPKPSSGWLCRCSKNGMSAAPGDHRTTALSALYFRLESTPAQADGRTITNCAETPTRAFRIRTTRPTCSDVAAHDVRRDR